jgi:hypothetical protein
MRYLLACLCALCCCLSACGAKENGRTRYENLAATPFEGGFPRVEDVERLKDEIYFQRAVLSYIWALPALTTAAMREGKDAAFGPGYNVMPVWKERLNAKTLITTPNADVIYGLGFLDLKAGPLVVEVPPDLQGVFDDAFQRPLYSEGLIAGKLWCGDVGLPGPDKGKGGKYLLLPPDYTGAVPNGYFAFRSRTYVVMAFWRGFFQDPGDLGETVRNMEKTRIYPLGGEKTAPPMRFPNASPVAADMLYPKDGRAFALLARVIDHEFVDPADMEMRGMLAGIGIVKGKPFRPEPGRAVLLDAAARTANKYAHALVYSQEGGNALSYPDRQWKTAFPDNAEFMAESYSNIDSRTVFFANAFSASPGMAVNMENVGAKYPSTFRDAAGEFLHGSNTYKATLPANVPAALFWSLTAYDPLTSSQLDNGQPFPSLNSMDRPVTNPDGSIDIYLGPRSPGEGKNWIRTLPGQGFFVILRLYGPTRAFFDKTWVPGDLVRQP